MVAAAKSFAESLGPYASRGVAVDRVASWLPPRPGGYRMYFRTADQERIPVSVLHDSPNALRLKIDHPTGMTTAQPVVFVSGRRRIMGSVQRATQIGDGTYCVDIALLWCSMATRQQALTPDHEVLLSC